jgi:pyruvate/2-oxoglutarate dehydrogenase complex dihydrolipoamide acyltransferase (E2) component
MGDEHRPNTWGGSGKRSVQAIRTTGTIQATQELPSYDAGPDATDAAKALAAEHGVDLANVTGTGSESRITKDDVAAHIEPVEEPEPEAEPETGDDEPEQLEVV